LNKTSKDCEPDIGFDNFPLIRVKD